MLLELFIVTPLTTDNPHLYLEKQMKLIFTKEVSQMPLFTHHQTFVFELWAQRRWSKFPLRRTGNLCPISSQEDAACCLGPAFPARHRPPLLASSLTEILWCLGKTCWGTKREWEAVSLWALMRSKWLVFQRECMHRWQEVAWDEWGGRIVQYSAR